MDTVRPVSEATPAVTSSAPPRRDRFRAPALPALPRPSPLPLGPRPGSSERSPVARGRRAPTWTSWTPTGFGGTRAASAGRQRNRRSGSHRPSRSTVHRIALEAIYERRFSADRRISPVSGGHLLQNREKSPLTRFFPLDGICHGSRGDRRVSPPRLQPYGGIRAVSGAGSRPRPAHRCNRRPSTWPGCRVRLRGPPSCRHRQAGSQGNLSPAVAEASTAVRQRVLRTAECPGSGHHRPDDGHGGRTGGETADVPGPDVRSCFPRHRV